MSAFSRLLYLPASRRNIPRGGRYFNSAKSPKGGVVAPNNNAKNDPSSEVQQDGVQGASANANAVSSSPIGDPQSSSSASTTAPSSSDFKMHQFFSLHRPLLLINQPASIFRPVPPDHPIFSPLQPEAEESNQQKFGLDAPLDPFVDADAEAARQLTRALTMTKAGSTLAWEDTLKHLGLDVSKDADRINLQQQFDKEWEEILLDSTKRKRRKK
ncbi:hypothetical protein BDZ97DRAFT_1864277 [Flammula alnicola]|nr:hypothetical protein BDZ97DRAFT_1864277 [Flammula alnicola]